MEHNTPPKEIPVQEIGSFFDTDADGYLINPTSKEKMQKDWLPIVEDTVEEYRSQYGDSLHSVYIRGSVGKGDAVAWVSDVDTFAYVTLKKDEINTDWMSHFEKVMAAKYPFAQGVELSVEPTDALQENKILMLQSACVYGNDISTQTPKIKAGKETLGHVHTLSGHLAWFNEWASKPQESEEIKKSCVWLMKRLIRTSFELTMTQEGLYTRDLYPCYKVFATYYPEKEAEMKEALYLALNPTDDIEVVKRISQQLGTWLEGQIKLL